MRIRSFLLPVLLAGALVPAAANAQPDRVPVDMIVPTAGVDLADPAGAQALYERLERASKAVCDSGSARLNIRALDRRCADQALAEAISRTGQPQLAALYTRQTGRQLAAMASATGAP